MPIEKWDKVIFKNCFAYSRCPYIYYTYIFMLMLLFRYIYFLLCFKYVFLCFKWEKRKKIGHSRWFSVNLIWFSFFFCHFDVRFLEIFFKESVILVSLCSKSVLSISVIFCTMSFRIVCECVSGWDCQLGLWKAQNMYLSCHRLQFPSGRHENNWINFAFQLFIMTMNDM